MAIFGCYGAARDALIARSKLVLSLHKHEALTELLASRGTAGTSG